MLVVLTVFKNRIDKYLIWTDYTYKSTSGLSINQGLPCLQPSKVFLGWQSCSILLNAKDEWLLSCSRYEPCKKAPDIRGK